VRTGPAADPKACTGFALKPSLAHRVRFLLLTLLKAALGIGLALASPALAADSNLYLVALAGQSNMTGAGDLELLPVGFPMNGLRIWNYTNADTWELAKEPVDSNSHQVDMISLDKHPGVGPALAMADAFAAKFPFVKVGLIPCAKSGSSIEEWRPDWSRSTLYGSCLYRQEQARLKGRVRAVVFWQGGEDAKDKKAAKHWGKNFERMITAWRADMGDQNLPVILLVLKPGTEQTMKKYPYRDIVRQQQLTVQMPYLTKLETVGYDYDSDNIHLTTAGQLAIGQAIAAALPAP
jgi:carbohydrate esterase-like sialic acid-specific acetylesterase